MTAPLSPDRARTALDAMVDHVDATLAQIEDFQFVADPDTGDWETADDGNWSGDHWIRLL